MRRTLSASLQPRAIATGLALLLAATPLAAFDSSEHERVADSALLLALSYWVTGGGSEAVPSSICASLAARGLPPAVGTLVRTCADNDEAITYGGTVRLVDELNYPSQIFVREGSPPEQDTSDPPVHPESYWNLNVHFRERYERRAADSNFARIAAGYRALSYNEVHFQNDLIQQMQRLYRDALQHEKRYIYSALLSNALSDHFLQDLFAPGHMLWPRNYSHDSVAISLHDGVNQNGAWFEVDGGYWRQNLADLAAFLERVPESSEVKTTLQENWLKRRAGAAASCATPDSGRGELAGGVDEGLACLNEAMAGDRRVLLYGDGLLSKSPPQQMLLLLVQARRIVDVLNTVAGCTGGQGCRRPEVNGIREIRSFNRSYSRLVIPCAALPFGRYKFHPRTCDSYDEDDEARRAALADEVYSGSVAGVLLLSGGGQAPFASGGSARYQFSLEHIPLGVMADWEWLRNKSIHKPPDTCRLFTMCNSGFAYGLDYLHDGDFTAAGAGLRFIKALPSVNLQFSPYLKYLEYRLADEDDWNASWGLRVDWGFSIGSMYIAVGREYVVDDGGDLEPGTMASFGIGFGLPQSRIRKWAVDNRRYRPGDDRRSR